MIKTAILFFCFLCAFSAFSLTKNPLIEKDQKNVIIITYEADFPPFCFFRDNKDQGIFVDLCKEIFKDTGIKILFEHATFFRTLTAPVFGGADACMVSYRSPLRSKYLSWAEIPWGGFQRKLYALKGYAEKIEEISGLKGQRLGLVENYYYPDDLLNYDQVTLVWSRSYDIAIKKLLEKRFDLIYITRASCEYFMVEKGIEQKLVVAGELESVRFLFMGFSFSPRGERLKKIFDDNYKNIIKNGTRDKIFKKWQKKTGVKKLYDYLPKADFKSYDRKFLKPVLVK